MGVLTWKQASADYEKKSAGSNTAGTTPPTSGMLSWKQAADEFDRYDEDGYKALGMQRMTQMQERYQAQKDRVSGMERLHADDTVNDWLNRYNRVIQGITRSEQKRNGGFTHDADSVYGAEIDALLSGYDGIKNHSEIRQYYDSLTDLKNSLSAINESFSQFEDESAFDQYMAYWKDQEEKKNLDLDAYSREIAALEQQLEDYDPQIDWTDTNQRKQYDKGLQELEDEINRRKQYLAQAQRIQKKDNLSAVANPESEKYDAAFESKSGYVSTEQDGKLQRMMSQYSMGYDDLTYEYINNQNGIRDTIKQKAGAYKKGETPFETKGYDYMTEDEVGLYNYYYSMGGKASAEAYLDTIQEDLNQRKAAGMYQQMEGKTGAELVFGVEAGLDQFKSGIKGAVRAVKGDDSYVAPSATQYASGMVREDLADDGFKLPSWLGGASVGQVGYDAITTSANMAPSIAVGMLNPTMGAAAMGVSAGGSAYQEALNEGYSVDQARGYGILSGASEIVMEKVLGGISAYGGNALGKFFTQNMKNADTALKRIAKELGGSMLSEFSEEYLQEVLTPVFQNLTLGTDNEVKLVSAEALYAGFLGAITGGVLEGPSAVARNATLAPSNATQLANNATAVGEKSTPGGVTEQPAAVDDKMSAAEAVAKNATTTVGVSKMETVQVKPDMDSFAQQFGTQAEAVKRNYMEGQDLQEYEVGFQTAYAMGLEGGKVEALGSVPYLSQSQREIAFSLGRDAAAAQKAAETKAATAKATTTKASLGQTAQLVDEDGSNGGTVTIAEIVSMDDSGMTLRLEDGRTVTDEDLDFPDGAEVYSTVMELGMDAESANAIVKASAAASIPRAAVAEGIETAYHYGRYGYGMDALLKAKEAAEIPENILQASYQAGEKRRQQRRETAQTEDNRAASKATTPERRGKVHFHGESNALNNVQKESLRGLEWIADLTGAQIHVENMGNSEGLSRTNGLYDPADDSIHIDLRAGSDGAGTLLYTAAHEFVHRMRQNNEAAFYRLADFLVEQYGKKGISTDALVKQQMADAAKDGIELNYDEAFEEMVADAMEAMFTDTDALAKMEKLKTQDKSLWQEIKDFVLGLAEKIKAAYARLKPDSAEARYVLQMKESIDQIAQLFAEGVMAEGTEPSDRTNTKVKYSFAGRSSATADRSALQQAEELAQQGVDNETIRQQTGWYKGMDGQWRYEIDDSQMEISDEIINYMQLGELVQHEKLYAAYPDLADISVVFQGLEAGVNGSYHPQFDSINLSYRLKNDPVGLKDALVHEIQHAIQHREGFTSGATAASWERKIKAGFDSRRAEDIRKAQETERELRRIQEEEPEFYRDMVELDAMTPDLPRGEVDWETLEKISDDPIEWQQYDARREELEAKYGDTKVWDMNDLLYQREKASKNMGRSGVELYFDTAGEIEARDASNRRNKSPEQRKTSPPRLGNEDTVFAEGSVPADDYIPGDVSDSELETGINNVAEMSPISAISGREFTTEGRTLLDDVDQFFKSVGGQVYNSRLGDINLTRRGVKDSLAHGMTPQKASAFAAIPDVLREGKVVGFDKNWKNRGYDSATVAAPITIGGEEYMMAVIVHRSNSANRFYVHDVFAVKKEATPFMTGTQNLGEPGGATSTISIIRKILSVKANQVESGKKFSRRKQSEAEALQEQNTKLQEDVDRLKELVKLQGKVTGGKIMKPSSVEAAAKYLKKLFHTNGDTKELAQKLNGLYEYIASDPELTWEGVKEQAASVVDWLQEHEKFQRSQYAQDILDSLKGQSFYLDETQLGEAKSQYGSVANYRRAVKNMASSKASQSLDQLWQELSSQYPDIFSPEISASDMPVAFAEAVERLEGMENTEFAMDWRMKDQAMLEAVYDSYWRVSGLETVADKYAKQINEIRGKHYEKMTELRKDRDQKLKDLKADKQQAVKTVRENRDRAAIRGKIRKTMRKLDMLLKSETKEKHVPDSMKKAVADALSLMNDIEIGTVEKRISALQHDIRNLKRKLEQAEGLGDRELTEEFRAQLDEKELALQRYEKSGGRLTALRDAYADIRNSDDPDIVAGYDAEVAGALAELADSIKDTSFQDMSREQLQDVLDMYTMVLTRIRDANKQFGARRGETLQENAAETEADIRKFGISEKDPGIVADKLGKLVRGFSWNNLRPVDAFHRLGSRKLEQLYMDLVDGMAQRGRQIKEIGQFITDIRKKTGYKSFDLKEAETYTTVDGKEMKLTLAEKMSIYAYSKRDQAYDHMAEGGFTYAKDLTYKEKGKTKVHTGKAKTWRLSMEDLQTICGSLTENQRQYVDAVQQFLTEFGTHGDKVNMELYGIKLFNKENAYFPLQSDRDYRKSVENQLGGTMTAASLKSDGMTKKTVPGANNPIVLEDFDRVVFRHLDKMANYANLVLPLENLRRVFDYQTSASENQAPASMKALIGATFGREAQQYVEQFLTDANGTRMSMGVQNPLEIMFTRSKGMAVAANLSVMIQQISAVVRAVAEISPKHLMWAAENQKGIKLYDEMVKYAPIAIIKDMGGFDTGSNRSLEDYIGFEEAPNSAKKVWNNMQKLFGMGAETMDKVGWCLIWNGVKREVASRQQYEVNSEKFLQECGKRFTEVIVKTQVYDSVLSRSGYMRDKHGTMRYLTSFMGEPTVQAGMVFNSHLDVVRAIQQKKDVRLNVKRLIRTDAALISALVVNGMLKAIPYAMRDDDEDEGYWERWAKQFGSALSELWKPWELLPILRNIDDLASGRTIEQPDMALLSDLLQVGTKVIHVMQDEEAMADMKPDDWYALAKELAGSVGNLLGVPVKNIWRDAEGYVRIWKDATDGIDSDGMLLDAMWRGLKGEEKTKHEGIYDAMVSGDTGRLDALKATYKTDGSYESAVRKALRLHDPRIKEMANARYEGDYDRLEALSYEIEAEGIFDMATIRAAYEAERTAQAKERGITLEEDSAAEQAEESTVFSMDEYYAAIRSGSKNSIQTAHNALIEEKKQEYYLEREAEDSIASSVTSKVKGEYLDEDISRVDAKSILTKYGGKSKAEAETEIKKWEFQMEYHYAWGSRDRCYRSGTITRSQFVSAVMDIEDASREEAQEYVDFLELEMQNEKVDITASEASSYFEHAKPHGISVEVYLDYKARTKGIQNDKDANGDSIPYTAVQKIMTEIDKLPISSNQKYALARSNGWAEKTIQKYKKW